MIARRCSEWSNLPYFDKHALAWLRSRKLVVVPSDKDGGFFALAKHTLNNLIAVGMQTGHYRRVAEDMVYCMLPHIRQQGLQLCKRLYKLGYISWAAECRERICESTVCNTTAVITCTVKTHKPVGEVVARVLHVSRKLLTEGLSAIIHERLDERISKLQHIAVHSEDLIAKVQAIECT